MTDSRTKKKSANSCAPSPHTHTRTLNTTQLDNKKNKTLTGLVWSDRGGVIKKRSSWVGGEGMSVMLNMICRPGSCFFLNYFFGQGEAPPPHHALGLLFVIIVAGLTIYLGYLGQHTRPPERCDAMRCPSSSVFSILFYIRSFYFYVFFETILIRYSYSVHTSIPPYIHTSIHTCLFMTHGMDAWLAFQDNPSISIHIHRLLLHYRQNMRAGIVDNQIPYIN